MLEIIALIYLCGKMGRLAERKGLKKGTWQLYTVLAWFGAEFIGIFFAMVILKKDDMLSILPFAYIFAVGGFLLIQYALQKKPDADQGFDFEKPDHDNTNSGNS